MSSEDIVCKLCGHEHAIHARLAALSEEEREDLLEETEGAYIAAGNERSLAECPGFSTKAFSDLLDWEETPEPQPEPRQKRRKKITK